MYRQPAPAPPPPPPSPAATYRQAAARETVRRLVVHETRPVLLAAAAFTLAGALAFPWLLRDELVITCVRPAPAEPLTCTARRESVLRQATSVFVLDGAVRAEREGSGEDREDFLQVGAWRSPPLPAPADAAAARLRACAVDRTRADCSAEVSSSIAWRVGFLLVVGLTAALFALMGGPRELTGDRAHRTVSLAYQLFGRTYGRRTWPADEVTEVVVYEDTGDGSTSFLVQLRLRERAVLLSPHTRRLPADVLAAKVRELLAWSRDTSRD